MLEKVSHVEESRAAMSQRLVESTAIIEAMKNQINTWQELNNTHVARIQQLEQQLTSALKNQVCLRLSLIYPFRCDCPYETLADISRRPYVNAECF